LVDFSFPENHFDVVFWDAFSPRSQPDLWTESAFERVFASMKSGGLLTTYCAQGQVRRNMKAAGLVVEKIPGPPGKREMMRAFKP
jgi:tRNA U34 5-methylaminomethyl-2-thiouridine-forming methyltransferase MnmC